MDAGGESLRMAHRLGPEQLRGRVVMQFAEMNRAECEGGLGSPF